MIAENSFPIALILGLLLVTYLVLRWIKRDKRRRLVIDGSNVMYWRDGAPDLLTLRQVILTLTEQGFAPDIVFDANAGYLLTGRHQNDQAFGKLLGLSPRRVLVVPKGTQADRIILTAARNLKARVVTNDRYRDHAEAFPEVLVQGYLIKGGYRDGALWLDRIGVAA